MRPTSKGQRLSVETDSPAVERIPFASVPFRWHFLAVIACLFLVAGQRVPSEDAEKKSRDLELIRLQLYTDMMYGTDDFYGENTDLSYIDGVRRTRIDIPTYFTETPGVTASPDDVIGDDDEAAPPPPAPPPPPPAPVLPPPPPPPPAPPGPGP